MLESVSLLEWVSVVFGLAYVILAARNHIACWPAALVNTATAIVLFWQAGLLMESALNVFYLIIAVYGWLHWQRGGEGNAPLRVSQWSLPTHLFAILAIAGLTLVSGLLLTSYTQAAFPYLDSFTTWTAIITTWMVARKVLENWLYWIVIDVVAIGLSFERGLVLYAGLFGLYSLIALYGYRNWRRQMTYDKH